MKQKYVETIASGYEWVCPECQCINTICEWREKVRCVKCGEEYEADFPEHAWG